VPLVERIRAIPLNVPVRVALGGAERGTSLSCVLVRIDTRDGVTGVGFTAITEEEVVAAAINEVVAPTLVGRDALDTESLWEAMYWLLSPRGQSGYAAHAIAAVDVALWDVKSRHLGLPLWRLLGGARRRVPAYATFGFGFLDREQLAAAARDCLAQGFRHLKMTVGQHALQRRDEPRPIDAVVREDLARIHAVIDAVGGAAELSIDANCSLDAPHARWLAERARAAGVAMFEEPVTHNDVRQLADLRRGTGIAVAAGQNEGLATRFADFFLAGALDVAQPNVVMTGGYTQCARIAGMAQAFNVAIGNGGAWPFHNMHLHAGLAHGGFVEYHLVAVAVCRAIYGDLPVAEGGELTLADAPGLGFTPDWDVVRELARVPLSRGRGKA
jgi:L-alanine-DL-glutamate epimerase-like enolase superfamily enzyme